MQIIINGQLAFIKKNTSFEYITENSLFTGSGGYTLSITFPLKDCPPNIAIFGHIHRLDVEKEKVVFDCDILDKKFFKSGSITITEISDVEVKTQFLEGRSIQNFDDSFDDIYINQLSLGWPNVISGSAFPPAKAWLPYPQNEAVPLPWVNNSSGNLQNEPVFQGSSYKWASPNTQLAYMPYLLHLLNQICKAIGYSGDFSAIAESPYKYLLVCNTLPAIWGIRNYAAALPNWSLTEFFEQLELFLFGEFVINHKAKSISFQFTTKQIEESMEIEIEKVVDEYTSEVSSENSCDFLGLKNLMYADNDNRFWAYRSCQWYIKNHSQNAIVYDRLYDLLVFAKSLKLCGYERSVSPRGSVSGKYTRGYHKGSAGHSLFYVKDVDTYFIMFCYDAELVKTTKIRDEEYNWYQYYNRLEPINQFGKKEVDENAEDCEIKIVPAWIDDTDEDYGPAVFLECGEKGSDISWNEGEAESTESSGSTFGGSGASEGGHAEENLIDYNSGVLAQSEVGRALESGEKRQAEEYFSCIYVGFWDGNPKRVGKLPHPIVDSVMTYNDFTAATSDFSLRLSKRTEQINRDILYKIDGKKKYNFSFLAKEIPDVNARFFIKGNWYVAEKITATFSENGMSELLKGVFYRLVDG